MSSKRANTQLHTQCHAPGLVCGFMYVWKYVNLRQPRIHTRTLMLFLGFPRYCFHVCTFDVINFEIRKYLTTPFDLSVALISFTISDF